MNPAQFRSVYESICRSGYSALGRTRSDDEAVRKNPWQYGSAYPPSYGAFGRYRFLRTLIEARERAGARILEVAAGGSFNAACLAEPGREVVVNDLRPLAEEVSHWTTSDRIRWVGGNLFDLSHAELGKFDLVIACEVLEHVAHGDKLVTHLKSFLRDGGTLLLTTPNGAYFRSKLPTWSEISDFSALEAAQFKPDADGHLYLYTPDELTGILTAAGFRTVHVELCGSPFISGGAGFRFLPQSRRLLPWHLRADSAVRRFNWLSRQLCTQLIATAVEGGPASEP